MIESQGIWRAAQKFIDRFGNDAVRQAKIRVQEMREAGDAEGELVWTDIVAAIKNIQPNVSSGEGKIH